MAQSPPPDWNVPARTIVIATVQRSGSSYLAELMTRTGRLGRPGEYFNPNVVRNRHPGRGSTIADCCRLVRELGTSDNDVAGIKLFPEHFARLSRDISFSAWFARPQWVRLRRRDMLGQAVSMVIARQTGAYDSSAAPNAEPVFSAVQISETIDRLCAREARWTAYFARTGIAPLEIAYEQLESDPDGVVRAVADAADIRLGGERTTAPVAHQRQRTALNDEWCARFLDELGDPDVFSVSWRRIRGWLGERILRWSANARPR